MDDEMDKACQSVGKLKKKKISGGRMLIRVQRVLSLMF